MTNPEQIAEAKRRLEYSVQSGVPIAITPDGAHLVLSAITAAENGLNRARSERTYYREQKELYTDMGAELRGELDKARIQIVQDIHNEDYLIKALAAAEKRNAELVAGDNNTVPPELFDAILASQPLNYEKLGRLLVAYGFKVSAHA